MSAAASTQLARQQLKEIEEKLKAPAK